MTPMKRPPTAQPPDKPMPDAATIDTLYGLEPVFEPGDPAAGGGEISAVGDDAAESAPFTSVCCPYCGESFETRLDLSSGSATYIEDCQVCCRPIEFCLTVGAGQVLESLELRCSD
jgi:hypothetical protein